MAHRTVRCALHTEQRFQCRCLNLGRAHVLAGPGIVVKAVRIGVEKPLAGLIEQAARVGQVESRVVLAPRCHHGRRPRVHEVHVALGVVEGDGGAVAHHPDALDAQVGHAPHLVEHHLGVFLVRNGLHSGGRHVERLLRLVHRTYLLHLLEVAHVARPDGFTAVHPQLAELQRPTVELRNVGHPELSLSSPALDEHAAADGHVAIGFQRDVFVLRTDDDGLRQTVDARLQLQHAPVAVVLHDEQPGLLQGLFDGEFTGFHFHIELARGLHAAQGEQPRADDGQ